jgi:hypothetical protein
MVSPERPSANGHAIAELDRQAEGMGTAFRTYKLYPALNLRAM